MKVFDKINSAKAVFDHICELLNDLKGELGKHGQHCFKGAAPILEVFCRTNFLQY